MVRARVIVPKFLIAAWSFVLQDSKFNSKVIINAIGNAGPREDGTRVGSGGTAKRQSVDVSSFRRISVGIFQICLTARKKSMRTIKTFAECLADEFILASKNDSGSGAIRKKEEIEKNALANR